VTAESPASLLRRAAEALRRRAIEATPGPWERPLDVSNRDFVIAELPAGEQPLAWDGGVIPAEFSEMPGFLGRYAGQRERVTVASCPSRRTGKFARPRSGRDLEYIAMMHPGVGLAAASWLESAVADAEKCLFASADGGVKRYRCRTCRRWIEDDLCRSWTAPLELAALIIREAAS
jgi:hypothetical protein